MEEEQEEEGRNNPHLASSRKNDPTCLNFGDCLVDVYLVSGGYLEIVWRMSGRCTVAVRRVSGRCLKGVCDFQMVIW